MSVVVTKEFIDEHTNITGAINSSQCTILGLDFKTDLHKGWKNKVTGMVISNASAELFKLLNGKNKIRLQQEVIDEFKKRREEGSAQV